MRNIETSAISPRVLNGGEIFFAPKKTPIAHPLFSISSSISSSIHTMEDAFDEIVRLFAGIQEQVASKWPTNNWDVISLTLSGSPQPDQGPYHVHICHGVSGYDDNGEPMENYSLSICVEYNNEVYSRDFPCTVEGFVEMFRDYAWVLKEVNVTGDMLQFVQHLREKALAVTEAVRLGNERTEESNDGTVWIYPQEVI